MFIDELLDWFIQPAEDLCCALQAGVYGLLCFATNPAVDGVSVAIVVGGLLALRPSSKSGPYLAVAEERIEKPGTCPTRQVGGRQGRRLR